MGAAFELFIGEKIKLLHRSLSLRVKFRRNDGSPSKNFLCSSLFKQLDADKFEGGFSKTEEIEYDFCGTIEATEVDKFYQELENRIELKELKIIEAKTPNILEGKPMPIFGEVKLGDSLGTKLYE